MTELREAVARMIQQSMWSPASGLVSWTPEKIDAAEEQAARLAEAILSLSGSRGVGGGAVSSEHGHGAGGA